MTDLEMTKLCAEAMELKAGYEKVQPLAYNAIQYVETSLPEATHITVQNGDDWFIYDPLHNDAQAMALVKKFSIMLDRSGKNNGWYASLVVDPKADDCDIFEGEDVNLNRAIVECVAKMQKVRA